MALNRLALAALVLGACATPPPPTTAPTSGRGMPRMPTREVLGHPALSSTNAPPATVAPLRITHTPDALQVYRSTQVHLAVELPAGHERATCAWSFGGGATPDDAPARCAIDHTFIGGTADERVTATATDGAWSETATRIIPLERLTVSTRPVEAATAPDGLPAKPTGQNSFRVVIVADTAGADAARLAALSRRIVAIGADLVVHVGGHARDGEEQNRLRESLDEGLHAAGIPLLSAVSPADLELGPEVRRPLGKDGEQLDLSDAEHFPERWSFSFDGVFMAFTSGAEQTDEALDWLRQRLTEAQIYESRIVFSYLPLHPFGEHVPDGGEVRAERASPGAPERGPSDSHTLGPKFKVYELLLRARTTALVTAGHHVYFKGRYGALPVVSVGSAAAGGDRLLGQDVAQASSIVVMDIARGLPQRVFALVDKGDEPFAAELDEAYLPDTVEVYTR